jgi:hypothetical protein
MTDSFPSKGEKHGLDGLCDPLPCDEAETAGR